jgi:hypothetical protein
MWQGYEGKVRGDMKTVSTITPRENMKLRLSGKTPEWMPLHGFRDCDTAVFRPRMNTEFIAHRNVFDCEPDYVYPSNIIKSDWFDLEWEYVPVAGGSTVRPGNPKVPDITNWEDYVSIPKIEQLDWNGCRAKNAHFFDGGEYRETVIFCSFWERLMALMDVGNAAIAMVDEEQTAGVHRLFDRLADFYCEYASRMKELFDIDMLNIHDDWCHQNGPFFSLAAARQMLVPYVRRLADHCHGIGVLFELHCCGRADILLPAIVETGADLWCPQDINDIYAMATQQRDAPLYFGVKEPKLPVDATPAQIRDAAEAWLEKYIGLKTVASFLDAPAGFADAVRESSRSAFADESHENKRSEG